MERLPWDVQALVARYLPFKDGFEPLKNRRCKSGQWWEFADETGRLLRCSTSGFSLRWCSNKRRCFRLCERGLCIGRPCQQSRASECDWQTTLALAKAEGDLLRAWKRARECVRDAPLRGYASYLARTTYKDSRQVVTLTVKLSTGETVRVFIGVAPNHVIRIEHLSICLY